MIQPALEDFLSFADAGGQIVPVWREFGFDTETAVTAFAKIAEPPFSFLLESVVGGETWARYTFLGTAPREAWRLRGGGRIARWTRDAGWSDEKVCEDPLAELERALAARAPVSVPGLPRFFGGAVGYLGYDVVRYVEHLPDAPPDDLDVPEGVLLFTDLVLAIDNLYGRAYAIASVDVAGADRDELETRYDRAVAAIDALLARLGQPIELRPLPLDRRASEPAFASTYTRAAFEHDVERIQQYIRAGDAFQVVLSQRLEVEFHGGGFDLYRALRASNPSPYLYFLDLDGIAIIGSSPEALVRVEEGVVTVRPIAGTRARGDPRQDDALAAELAADPKERAEHLMLVDLGRNDVGRIAQFGSVEVPEIMQVERYSHVLHLVSRVTGRLREGCTAVDALRACFPAGTVSGAPKIRAMQIIDELEPRRRGVYAGAVGYFAYGGRTADTAIAIRTILLKDARAYVQAGAGVVADSVPSLEFEETLAKARALLRVLAALTPG